MKQLNKRIDRHGNRLKVLLLALFTTVLLTTNCHSEPRLIIGNFSAGNLDGWQEKTFKDRTLYRFVKDNNSTVLQADSHSNASGLVYNQSVDLTKTPVLHWSWKVSHSLGNLDDRTQSGDDYAARIYIVVSGGLAFWNTRSLNYVWANSRPEQTAWPNAFAGQNVMMIAQQSGNEKAGQWIHEQRNIRKDFKQFFQEDIKTIDAIAIMTDTDNSSKQAMSWYGDIYFSTQ